MKRKNIFLMYLNLEIIEKHLSNTTNYSSFSNNILVQDAVQRRLAIIGEALWKITKLKLVINITDLQKIIGFRHILIHDYDRIETPTIWLIVTKNLQLLKMETETILKKSDGSTSN